MSSQKKLQRSDNRLIAGVCAGIAEYFELDPVLVRILFLVSGIGILSYIILAIMIPSSESF